MMINNTTPSLTVAHISDCHVLEAKQNELKGVNCYKHLQQTIDSVNQTRPDMVLITGDLTETASAAGYRLFDELVSAIEAPIHCLAGNHDNHETLADTLSSDYQWNDLLPMGNWVFWPIDTVKPGHVEGYIDGDEQKQLDALTEKLQGHKHFICLAMHHQPLVLNKPFFDQYGLQNREQIDKLVARKDLNIRCVLFGHVHDDIWYTTKEGIVYSAAPASCFQIDDSSDDGMRVIDDSFGFKFYRFFDDGSVQGSTIWVSG